MTHVKICGLTTANDVKHAASYGAWACGFVLSQSPRRIDAAQAAALTPLCGESMAVAVVTTEEPAWIAGALAAGGFGAVQLSAGADGPSVAAVRAAALSRGLRPFVIAAADVLRRYRPPARLEGARGRGAAT
jgi:phosphoribosylanthranilate isomerase